MHDHGLSESEIGIGIGFSTTTGDEINGIDGAFNADPSGPGAAAHTHSGTERRAETYIEPKTRFGT